MAMSNRTQVQSVPARRELFQTRLAVDVSAARRTSGYRITRSTDDTAGLGISVSLESEMRRYNQASRNAADLNALLRVARQALESSSHFLGRLRSLASDAASEQRDDRERRAMEEEAEGLLSALDEIVTGAGLKGQPLFDKAGVELNFEVGIRGLDDEPVTARTTDLSSGALGLRGLRLGTAAQSSKALEAVDAALGKVAGVAREIGALAERLDFAVVTLQSAAESLSAANSRIRDVDVSDGSFEAMRDQILLQTGVSVMAQANQLPTIALRLLQ